jgi:acetyltransferase-like isoleucine patch superfamily enzyme
VHRRLSRLRTRLYRTSSKLQTWYYRRVWGMTIGDDCRISTSAKLDKTNPRGMHVGDSTLISFDAAVLTHDFVGNKHLDTFIGSNCFIGARSIILAGIRIGDHCVVGAGSVVIADVPSNSIVVGNPARIVRSDIVTGRWGILDERFLKVEAERIAREMAAGR